MNAGGVLGKLNVTTDKGWSVLPQGEALLKPTSLLPSDITSDMILTADKIWIIDGLVTVHAPAVLTIKAGTQSQPIVFTSALYRAKIWQTIRAS